MVIYHAAIAYALLFQTRKDHLQHYTLMFRTIVIFILSVTFTSIVSEVGDRTSTPSNSITALGVDSQKDKLAIASVQNPHPITPVLRVDGVGSDPALSQSMEILKV